MIAASLLQTYSKGPLAYSAAPQQTSHQRCKKGNGMVQ